MVTVKETGEFTMKVALLALVMDGACALVRENVAGVARPETLAVTL